MTFKSTKLGCPGGPVVKNPLDNAGNMGSIPGPGRSHMPIHHSYGARAPSTTREATTMRSCNEHCNGKELEKGCTQQRRPGTAKNIKENKSIGFVLAQIRRDPEGLCNCWLNVIVVFGHLESMFWLIQIFSLFSECPLCRCQASVIVSKTETGSLLWSSRQPWEISHCQGLALPRQAGTVEEHDLGSGLRYLIPTDPLSLCWLQDLCQLLSFFWVSILSSLKIDKLMFPTSQGCEH